MRLRMIGCVLAVLAVSGLAEGTASACMRCHRTPCAYAAPAPVPAVRCVTEMVPYTVMQTRTRIDYQPVTETIMVREPQTTYTERQRVICRPVVDVTYVERTVSICKPVYDTEMVTQTVPVCRPVTETHQVTEYCLQPTTQYVSVPVRSGKCGRCGHAAPSCGCQTVAQTCYTRVPVVRDVTTTRMVRDCETRQVPVVHCRLVREEKVEKVPVTKCRLVQETITEKIPHTTWTCTPKQVTRQVPVPVCETVPVTCYRPVTRIVPCEAPAPLAAAQAAPAPSGQAGASAQQ
jgi:hypothetical protein